MDWKWNLADIKTDKDVTVFSCFSCGGGSSMGYKRAGFKVIGNVELDPRINEVYLKNQHPKYNFCMDLREFNKLEEIPEELLDLDILDGSPPCSTFSMAGSREKAWGKEKAFREGQKKQRLDDLFFVFLDTVEKLRPKIVVAENVKGLIMAKAKGYCNEIIKRFHELGYEVQIFCLNGAYMDTPQARERVFFIANRCGYPKLNLKFKNEPIKFGEVRSELGKPITSQRVNELLKKMKPGDRCLADIIKRQTGNIRNFSSRIVMDGDVCGTITSAGEFIRGCDRTSFSDADLRNVQTFPQDYDFCGQNVQYICGMSVPPNMMAHIAEEIYKQWLS